jgi:hypothetical protein
LLKGYLPLKFVESFQALVNCITQFLLEDEEHRGRLKNFDAQLLEVVVLIIDPISQCFASRAWSVLSLERRLCRDLILQLEEIVEEKVPLGKRSPHPLLRQLEAATAHVEKVFFFSNYIV